MFLLLFCICFFGRAKVDFRKETICFFMTTRFFDGYTANYQKVGSRQCRWQCDFTVQKTTGME